MSLLLTAALLLQAGDDEAPAPPGPRSAVEAGAAFLRLDPALGAESGFLPGFEVAFYMSKTEPDHTIGFRAYYRRWEVTFDEFNQLPADLDGDVQQLGIDLVVTYPLLDSISL